MKQAVMKCTIRADLPVDLMDMGTIQAAQDAVNQAVEALTSGWINSDGPWNIGAKAVLGQINIKAAPAHGAGS